MEDQHGWYGEHIPDLYQCRWTELLAGLEPVYPVSLVEFLTRQQHVRTRAGNCSEGECDGYPALRLTQWRQSDYVRCDFRDSVSSRRLDNNVRAKAMGSRAWHPQERIRKPTL